MDRKTALAIVLMLIVAILPSILFSPKRQPGSRPPLDTVSTGAPIETVTVTPPTPTPAPPPVPTADPDSLPEEIVEVESSIYRWTFSTKGARLVGAELTEYRSFAPDDSGVAQVIPPESRFLEYGLLFGTDTIALADWAFQPSHTALRVAGRTRELEWVGREGAMTVRLVYTFHPDRYLFDVRGQVDGVESGGLLLVHLGPRLAFVEADSATDFRSYAVVTKAGNTSSLAFKSLDPGEPRQLTGPFEWVAVKSKYFLSAVLAVEPEQQRFGGAMATGGSRIGKHAVRTAVVATLPLPAGAFSHSVYVGPQEFDRLARIGHDLQDVNPYGWIFRPIIRPFANIIVRILLWTHERINLPYGWVLILFGIAVRLVLWPLNQKAMRSSIAMQAIQPEMRALQDRHKQDPQRLQQEMMKLYKEHKVNPLGGCLPILPQMPFLFALFFVFRETIEFRGVPFLWVPDLARADPYLIIPILVGVSMFVVSKIGMRGVPPNPQMKMMLYIMPPFLTFIFLQLSAGLNLYYATSNIASIPQQWLIARERVKRLGKSV